MKGHNFKITNKEGVVVYQQLLLGNWVATEFVVHPENKDRRLFIENDDHYAASTMAFYNDYFRVMDNIEEAREYAKELNEIKMVGK